MKRTVCTTLAFLAFGAGRAEAAEVNDAICKWAKEAPRACVGPSMPACEVVAKVQDACAEAEAARMPRRDDLIAGFQVSDAAQVRIPRMDGVPSLVLSNVLGLGLVVQKGHLEFSPQAHLIFSSTTVQNAGEKVSESASGFGGEVGVRVAVGWFDAVSSGFYFSFFPAFSSWKLNATYRDKSTYSVRVAEASFDLGIGYKVRLGERLRIDVFANVFRFGVRPQQQDIVDFTSYPTLGLGVDVLPGRW